MGEASPTMVGSGLGRDGQGNTADSSLEDFLARLHVTVHLRGKADLVSTACGFVTLMAMTVSSMTLSLPFVKLVAHEIGRTITLQEQDMGL